jgi:hypothetical protein
MNADAIREFLHREPFEPFVIRMSNGETHEGRHPECAFVMRTKVLVYYPDAVAHDFRTAGRCFTPQQPGRDRLRTGLATCS